MYTSFDKISDRFGFSTGGTFRCAYKNTRVVISAGIITICVLTALTLLSLVFVAVRMKDLPSMASAQITAMIGGFFSGEGFGGDAKAGSDLVSFGAAVVSISFGILLLIIAVISFAVICAVMHTGQNYIFKADEEKFTVVYPKSQNRTLTVEYDYIVGLSYTEWQYLLAPKCMDITIQTKDGDFTFRVIHTPMSKANGITETPFNIIRERIGLANRDESVLIDREAARDQKTGLFR